MLGKVEAALSDGSWHYPDPWEILIHNCDIFTTEKYLFTTVKYLFTTVTFSQKNVHLSVRLWVSDMSSRAWFRTFSPAVLCICCVFFLFLWILNGAFLYFIVVWRIYTAIHITPFIFGLNFGQFHNDMTMMMMIVSQWYLMQSALLYLYLYLYCLLYTSAAADE